MQRVVGLLHQPKISATDDAAIRLRLRAFAHVKMIDPDQRDVVASNRFDATVHHRLSPLDTVRLDFCAVKMEGTYVTGLMNDCLTTFCFRRSLPQQRTDPDDATRRTFAVSRIGSQHSGQSSSVSFP